MPVMSMFALAPLFRHAGITVAQLTALTRSALSGWALGEPDFVADLQTRTARRVSPALAGRPVSVTPSAAKK